MNSEFQNISFNAQKVWRIHTLILYSISTPILLICVHLLTRSIVINLLILVAMAIMFMVDFVFLSKLKQENFKYKINDSFIEITSGRFFHKRRLIPIDKIAYVKQKEGPIIRKYNLVNLELGTVVDSIEIPCLLPKIADELQRKLG